MYCLASSGILVAKGHDYSVPLHDTLAMTSQTRCSWGECGADVRVFGACHFVFLPMPAYFTLKVLLPTRVNHFRKISP
jgi:hypothetical protein